MLKDSTNQLSVVMEELEEGAGGESADTQLITSLKQKHQSLEDRIASNHRLYTASKASLLAKINGKENTINSLMARNSSRDPNSSEPPDLVDDLVAQNPRLSDAKIRALRAIYENWGQLPQNLFPDLTPSMNDLGENSLNFLRRISQYYEVDVVAKKLESEVKKRLNSSSRPQPSHAVYKDIHETLMALELKTAKPREDSSQSSNYSPYPSSRGVRDSIESRRERPRTSHGDRHASPSLEISRVDMNKRRTSIASPKDGEIRSNPFDRDNRSKQDDIRSIWSWESLSDDGLSEALDRLIDTSQMKECPKRRLADGEVSHSSKRAKTHHS